MGPAPTAKVAKPAAPEGGDGRAGRSEAKLGVQAENFVDVETVRGDRSLPTLMLCEPANIFVARQ
jgi:hypothetical protein